MSWSLMSTALTFLNPNPSSHASRTDIFLFARPLFTCLTSIFTSFHTHILVVKRITTGNKKDSPIFCAYSRLPNPTMSQYAFDRISKDQFEQTLAQYSETVPSKLADLEEQRLSAIPVKLRERKAKGNAYLTKAEVATLVDWKL